MDPNQQSNQTTPPSDPNRPGQPYVDGPTPQQGSYDANYLDSIAPAPARAKFLSGTFGKLFYALIGLFVIGVSLIIAFSGKDDTADLQQMTVRLQNFAKTTKTVQKSLKSEKLSANNSTFQIWITGNQSEGATLLKEGGVQKTQYNKDMVKREAKYASDLDAKFEDARLSARLNRVYASTMASETEKLINLLNTMSKKSKSAKIRDYAKNASTNLVPISKAFNDYTDDGN